MTLNAEQLARLSTLLDQAPGLDGEALEPWLTSLGDEPLLPALRAALARRRDARTADLPSLPAPWLEGLPTREGGQIGPYRLLRELGAGGMGTVWLAERADGLVHRKVALKRPHAGWAPALTRRFAREREILAALEHPHIARLYDVGVDDHGRPYMALEYVEGEPIDAHCRRCDLGARPRVELLLQVVDAVAHAHRRGVLHRDLKAANVLVRSDGHAQLLDFGIGKLLADDDAVGRTELTQVGARPLTLHCAAPEQLDGTAVGPATDVWALGVLLYELMAGQRPFGGSTQPDVEAAIRHLDPPPPSRSVLGVARSLRHDAAADLDTVVAKALAKSQAERYESADALAADLRRWLDGEPIRARPESAPRRALRLARRHHMPLTIGGAMIAALAVALGLGATALVIAALGLGLGAALWQTRVARRQAQIAQDEASTSAAVEAFVEGIFAANSAQQMRPAASRERSARELLDDAATRIEDELSSAPQVKLRLLRIMARLYLEMQEPTQAVQMHQRHRALVAALHGQSSAAHAQALADLGCVLAQAEDIPAARIAIDDAAALLAALPSPAEGATASLDLGRAMLAYRTDPSQGVEPGRRAYEAWSRGPVSADRLIACDVYARCLHFVGQLDEARRIAEEGIAAARVAPDRWAHYTNDLSIELARIFGELGDIDAARSVFEGAMRRCSESVGPSGHQTLSCMALLGTALVDNSRLAEGASWLERALEALCDWPESEDKNWQMPLFAEYLAGVLARHGRAWRAIAVADLGLRSFDATRHTRHWAQCLQLHRAEALLQLGLTGEACDAIDAAMAHVESDPQVTGFVRRTLAQARARLLAAQGHGEDARALWLEQVARPMSEMTVEGARIRMLCVQGEFELAAGDPGAAIAHSDEAIALLRDFPRRARFAWYEAQAHRWRGEGLLRQGLPREAHAALAESLRLVPGAFDEHCSRFVAATLVMHARALRAGGDPVHAREQLRAARAVVRHCREGAT